MRELPPAMYRLAKWREMYMNASDPEREHTGQQPIDPFDLDEIIEELERWNIIKSGQAVMELGCGRLISSIQWLLRGYSVEGWEISQEALEIGKQIKDEIRIENPPELITHHGSYYPAEYLEWHTTGSRAPEIEKGDEFREEFFLEPGPITPNDFQRFDIVFVYPYNIQLPSLFEMFRMYARNDAVLVVGFPCDYPKGFDDYIKKLGVHKVANNAYKKVDS